ncbi:MAG: Wzz/FepE/Etk N-terminal domain-containing protein [bacterium]|nr:Wzz/FepE/Etk N-terminal domain-containing protein [bacterium]
MRQELRKYIFYILKRIWIVLLLTALVAGSAYVYLSRQPRAYRAEVKILVGNQITSANPDLNSARVAEDLVPTYIELARSRDILQATIDDLDLSGSVNGLRRRVNVREVLNTSIFIIRVTDTNRQRAADTANALAENLIELSPTNPTPEEQTQLRILSQQIEDLQVQIDTRSEQAIEVGADLDEARTAGNERDVFDLTQQYNQIIEQLDTARGVLAQLSDSYQSLNNRINRLTIAEEATPPGSASNINHRLVTVLAAAGTFGLGIAGLLLYLEYFDGKIRIENEIVRWVQVPVLGSIRSVRGINKKPVSYLVTQHMGTSAYEDFRTVLTKLLFSESGEQVDKVYMIASPIRREGRSFIAANLAVIMADAGVKTLLIDANLRSPILDKVFELDNSIGLVPLLGQINNNPEYEQQSPNDTQVIVLTRHHIQDTSVKNLKIMTSGLNGTEVSSDMMGFQNLRRSLDAIQREFDFDVILIDTPPALSVSDAYVMAASIGAEVILVIDAGNTDRGDVIQVRDQFLHTGNNLSGAILNTRPDLLDGLLRLD